jgi:hypothetical protein
MGHIRRLEESVKRRSFVLFPALLSGVLLLPSCNSQSPPASGNTAPAVQQPAPITSARATPAARQSTNYEGFLEIVDDRGIGGWAWDKTQPNSPVQVSIYDGDTVLLTLPADKHRKDLADNHKGNGNHGFETWLLPQLKDGKAHQIRAKISKTDFELGNSPRSLTYSSQSN